MKIEQTQTLKINNKYTKFNIEWVFFTLTKISDHQINKTNIFRCFQIVYRHAIFNSLIIVSSQNTCVETDEI